jgi:hypothetical protein
LVRGGQLSYRRRRRLAVLSALCVIGGGIAAAIVLLPTGKSLDRGPTSLPPAAEARPSPAPRQTRLSAAERHRLVASISLFVTTSVARHHPEQSWPIVHPILREGMTKRQWSTGNIPVVPYPAIGVDLIHLDSVVRQTALVEIVLEPKPGAHLARKTFQIELRRLPRSPHLWAVSSWVPEGVSETQMALDRHPNQAVIAAAYHAQHLSVVWIIALLAALGAGVILLPAFVLFRDAGAGSFRRKRSARRSPRPPDAGALRQ